MGIPLSEQKYSFGYFRLMTIRTCHKFEIPYLTHPAKPNFSISFLLNPPSFPFLYQVHMYNKSPSTFLFLLTIQVNPANSKPIFLDLEYELSQGFLGPKQISHSLSLTDKQLR